MRKVKISVIAGFLMAIQLFAAVNEARADNNTYYYGTRKVGRKNYYVYLYDNGGTAELWFRVSKCTCSKGDVGPITLKAKKQSIDSKKSLKDAAKKLCSVKEVLDNGRTVIGCACSGSSIICLTAPNPVGCSAAAYCSVGYPGSLPGAFADCVFGVSDWIASKLGKDKDWAAVSASVNVNNGQWADAISSVIDYWCSDL